MERLDGYVAQRANIPRKDAKAAIKRGKVAVDGAVELSPERKIDTETVSFDGRVLPRSPFVYIAMNKPAGVLSASEDKRQRTVLDLLPERLGAKGLFPVGRLDKDTTGLLIITNDGAAAHRLLAPASHVDKVYEAELDGDPTEADAAAFAEGVELDGFTALPAELEPLGNRRARVTLHEGKFHQVKRMFAARGLTVLALKRVAFGGVALPPDLAEGEARSLTESELALLGIKVG